MSDAMLVALQREAAIVNSAARARHVPVMLEVSGMGPLRARVAAQRQVVAGATSLTSVGFAGALRAPLQVGDLLLPREVIGSSGQRLAVDANVHKRLLGALGALFHIRQGALTSVDYPVGEAARKSALGNALDADAVDMESVAIARVASEAGIPFAVLRVVCDGPQQRIPHCTEGAVDAYGRVIIERMVIGLMVRPWELLDLFRLARGSARASRVLGRALGVVFEHAHNT
jgi:adenosylhomocysteine nucleosidase